MCCGSGLFQNYYYYNKAVTSSPSRTDGKWCVAVRHTPLAGGSVGEKLVRALHGKRHARAKHANARFSALLSCGKLFLFWILPWKRGMEEEEEEARENRTMDGMCVSDRRGTGGADEREACQRTGGVGERIVGDWARAKKTGSVPAQRLGWLGDRAAGWMAGRA